MSQTQLRMALRESGFSVKQYPEIKEESDGKYTALKIFWDEPVPARLLSTLLHRLPSDVMVKGRPHGKGIEMAWIIA